MPWNQRDMRHLQCIQISLLAYFSLCWGSFWSISSYLSILAIYPKVIFLELWQYTKYCPVSACRIWLNTLKASTRNQRKVKQNHAHILQNILYDIIIRFLILEHRPCTFFSHANTYWLFTDTSLDISMLEPIFLNRDFQIWHLIGWQHSHQPIRSHHVRQSMLTNMDFNRIFLSNPGPCRCVEQAQCVIFNWQ